MSPVELTLLAVSLSLDVAVISVGAGALNRLMLNRALLIALLFALLHALMPIAGWALGSTFAGMAAQYGHIVGFVLMFAVGANMLKGALSPEDTKNERDILHLRSLFILAFAASIDAFVIGITFTFIDVSLVLAVAIIGIVTLIVSLLGMYVGRRTHHLLGTKIEIAGACILIALAFKILLT